jgi:hypothetical protein
MIVQNWSELEPLAAFAVERARQTDSDLNSLFASIGPHDRKLKAGDAQGALERALAALKDASDEACHSDRGNGRTDFGASLPLLHALNEQQQFATTEAHIILCVYGDGALGSERPEVAQRATQQALLMTLIQARYILDVIDEYRGKRAGKSFAEYVFCPHMTTASFSKADGDDRADVAASPAAKDVRPRLTCEEQVRLAERVFVAEEAPDDFHSCLDNDRGCTQVYAAPVAITRYAAYVIEPASSNRFTVFDPVFAFSASFKSGSGDASNGVWGIETLPIGWPGARDYLRDRDFNDLGWPNVGVAFGYEGPIAGSGSLNYAYTTRLVWALPRLDMLFSAYGKKMKLEDAFRRHDGWGYGLRFETGFSLLTAYLSFGREPVLEHGFADRDEVFGAGVTFSISSRRALQAATSWLD